MTNDKNDFMKIISVIKTILDIFLTSVHQKTFWTDEDQYDFPDMIPLVVRKNKGR